MQIRHVLFALLIIPRSSLAQWHSAGNVDATSISGNVEANLQVGGSLLTIRVLTNDLVRVRFQTEVSNAPDRSWAVVKTQWPDPSVQMKDSPGSLVISTPELTLVVGKKPLRLTFRDKSGGIINADYPALGTCWMASQIRLWKSMPLEERYYGFGEKTGSLQKRDVAMTMWNSDIPAYTPATDPLYQSVPFFYGIRNGKAYGIFLDNTYRSSFDMGKEFRDAYSFGAEGGELDYYFFYGPAPKKVLSRFAELVGLMPLPPRWSLGYQQCRWSYPTETRVREIARGFRSRNIPCDVIYLDIDYMDGYRIFTWNTKSFPNPARMISDLGTEGFHIAVIVDPGIKVDTAYGAYRSGLEGHVFVRNADGSLYTGAVWPGTCAFPDFTSSAARLWWGNQFSALVSAGVRGWWNDMNEPSVFDVPTKTIDLSALHDDQGLETSHAKNHNIYGMQMTRATYEGIRRMLPNERPFVLTRASFAGGERYSAAWTGDNVASWEHLGMALSMCLSMSISAQPFVGSDIGGFIGFPSGELFARWLQLGVFTPLMRAHSVINEKNKEPWEYGSAFTEINKATIGLRYRLLPYIYTAMAEASSSGMPPMRPMLFEFPDEPRLADKDDEFMFGPDLLVAPVLTEGTTRRSVELPRGHWIDFWTGTKYDGGNSVTVDAPVSRIPLFARAGAVIPTQQIVQYTGQAPIGPLTLLAFPPDTGVESSSQYYEDDGISYDYSKGAFLRRKFQLSSSRGTALRLSAAEGSYLPPGRKVVVRFIGVPVPVSVQVGGRKYDRSEGRGSGEGKGVWTYDTDVKAVELSFEDTSQALQILLQY